MKKIKSQTIEDHYSLMIYGIPKIGLTEIASQATGSILYLNLKDDVSKLNCINVSISNWLDFLSVGNDIVNGKYKFNTIVLGHIEDLWEYLCNHITEKFNLENGTSAQNISELSYGEWRRALNVFENKLKKFLSLGNMILLSHELTELRNIRGVERTHFLANIERKAQLIVLNLVDAIGRLYTSEQDLRVLSFIPKENQITGSRIIALLKKNYVIRTDERPEFYSDLKKDSIEIRRAS